MNKSWVVIAVIAIAVACNKNEVDSPPPTVTYEDTFQISFRLDGKEYSKVLQHNEKNHVTGSGYHDGNGNSRSSTGPIFFLDSGYIVNFTIGFFD